jgi:subtilisin family serine protease/undecaprenyl pyrophosphate phosphatase UppP
VVLAVLLLPAGAAAQQAPLRGAALRDAVSAVGGRVIVTLKRPAGAPAMMAPGAPPVSLTGLQVASSRFTKERGMANARPLLLAGAVAGRVTPDELAALEADPQVELVEPDTWMPLQEEREWPSLGAALVQSTPWGITRVQAPEAWAIVGKGAGIKVGIMDSGGDADHPDLNFAGGYNAMTQSTAMSAWQDDVSICNGHGTHVAGTVAALDNDIGVVGVAPEVSLYALKVFESINGSCGAWSSSQIQALNWAVSQGIRVVNASIGGSATGSYMLAVSNAAANGTYLVASAGNTGGVMMYPAGYADAIGVAALTSSNVKASFSSVGPEMDFAAPGSGIQSTMPGGGYGSKSGTSMASPHVAGVAALLLAQNPGLTFSQLYDKLKAGAVDVDAGGFDNNTGWGMVQAAASLGGGGGPAPVPLAMTVSPTSRTKSAVAGAAVGGDSATVTLTGDNSSSTAWTATKKKAWTTLTTASGTGTAKVKWNRSTSGLSAGTYVDTITVSAAGVSPRTVIDTLVITAAPVPLAMSISPTSRTKSAVAGAAVGGDSATVTLSGDNSSSTAWTATKKKAWTTLTTASGTGSGKVKWNRSTSGLSAGTYVDTITVAASGLTSKTVIDTLVITAAPVPLAMTVAPTSRSTTAQTGTAADGDSATVTLSGDNSSSTAWTATKKKAWTTLTTASGTGSGKVKWNRSTNGLSAGTYVDTITVSAAGVSPRTVIDTLVITAAPVPLAMSVSPTSRSTTAQAGTAADGDSATVTLSGDNSSSTAWSATKKKAWTTLTTANGTGTAKVKWNRSTSGLAAGTYVDTITVAVSGLPSKTIIDTLMITAAPVPLAMSVSPTSRSTTAQAGTAVGGDSATVTLSGNNSSSTAWSATKKKAWTTLTTASGTGSGKVKWNRNTNGLSAGIYVDTITVAVSGLPSKTIIDTLMITAAPVPLAMSVSPTSRSTTAQAGTAAGGDSATVTLSGDNSGSTAWSATKQKAWTTLTTASGTGSGKVKWNRSTSGLSAGTYVDTITVAVSGLPSKTIIDTLVVTPAPVVTPPPTEPLLAAVAPMSRLLVLSQQNGWAPDSAALTITGAGSEAASWTVAARKAHTSILTASGTGTGMIQWRRRLNGLAPGTYVDTITVTVAAAGAHAIIDSLIILPQTAADLSKRGGRTKVMENGRGRAASLGADTTSVTASTAGDTGGGNQPPQWVAATTAPWIRITNGLTPTVDPIRWERELDALPLGRHIDSVVVVLSTNPALRGVYVDTVDVILVTEPTPALAVEDLARGGKLNTDQRDLFDAIGNRNGRYDLGDFLAWVDRNQIALTGAMMQSVVEVQTREAAAKARDAAQVIERPDSLP